MMMSSSWAKVKEKSFKTPVISSWKYTGACTSPKGTLMYLYFPNGEVNAVLGIGDSSKGIWWYPTHRSSFEKSFAPFNWEKIFSTFGMNQINFCVTLLSAQQLMIRCFPLLPLGTTMMGADQLDWLPHITFTISIYFILDPFVVFHCYWVWLSWYWFRSSCIYCHLCQRHGSNGGFILGKLRVIFL